MSVRLASDDFKKLVNILRTYAGFANVRDRRRLVEAALEGVPRGADLLAQLDLDGAPQLVAVEVIKRLAEFGQVAYGKEALGVLLNYLQPFVDDETAATLADIHHRYALEGPVIPSQPLLDWRSPATVADVSEKIIGENTLRPIHYLELALAAARAVVRLRVPTADGAALGSGFMIAADLLMTNHHVIGSRAQAEGAEYSFNYQLDRDGKPCPVTTVGARPGGLFHTQPDLDYTVVQLAEPPAFGDPLRLRAVVAPREARVAIIQHPGGHFKKISLQNNFVAYADNRVVQYFTSTEPGSSGSPVFDDDFAVVAIHHSGGLLEEPGSGRRYLRNAGTSMGAVLADLKQAAPDILARLRP